MSDQPPLFGADDLPTTREEALALYQARERAAGDDYTAYRRALEAYMMDHERLGLSSSREPIVRYEGSRWPIIRITRDRA